MISINTGYSSESAVISHEDEVYIYLSTDDTGFNKTFHIILEQPMEIILALDSIYKVLIPSNIPIPADHSNYNQWLSTEILRRVAEKSGMADNIDPIKKEDYETIVNRRDDLRVRIKAQLNHLEKVKHLIPIVKKRQELLWKDYAFPLLSMTEEIWSLTVISRRSISTLHLQWKSLPNFFGFVEFSIPFYEALDAAHQNRISLSNISPTRGNNRSIPKQLRYTKRELQTTHNDFALQYIIDKQSVGRSLTIEQVELFDLLSRIRIYDPNKVLRISISSGSERTSIKLKGLNVVMKLARKVSPIEFSVPLHFLQTIIPITYLVTSLTIHSTFLGVHLKINTPFYTITKTYVPEKADVLYELIAQRSTSLRAQNMLFESLEHKKTIPIEETSLLESFSLILEGKAGYNPISKLLYLTNRYKLPQSRLEVSLVLSGIMKNHLKMTKYQLNLDFADHHVEILIADLLKITCSCGKLCNYSKSSLHILLEDRGYV